MSKLSPELIAKCPQYLNPHGAFELDIRGLSLPSLDNLGVTKDIFESIDMSSNHIRELEALPYLPNLKFLYAGSNRIHHISQRISDSIPNIESVVLTNNLLTHVSDIEPFSKCTKLTDLTLLNNPLMHEPEYRLKVVALIPTLKVLDFSKITTAVRRELRR